MKTLITRIKRLALALCFVTPLVSWAAEMTNPVTGETETYVNTFTGKNSSEWNAAGNWDTTSVPYIQNGVYTSALIDGKTASTASASIDGWALQVGAYNGATVTWKSLGKIQGDSTMWLTVDGTSSIAINGWGGGNLGQNGKNLNYYVAANNGVTWSVDLASGTDQGLTMNYYLAGNGSVSYQALGRATHVIKQADVTLSGTSQVSSKTLVSFTSSSTTFTADAAIKVKNGDNVLKTVYLTSVRTADDTTLTADDDVGACELVQTPTGIVLYYVDGDPADVNVEEKTYKPSININFTNGANNGLTTQADVGLSGYEVPGTSWNNYVVANSTFSTVNAVDSTGAASEMSGVSVTISGTRGSYSCGSLTPSINPLHGYIDENGNNPTPTVTVTGIPYYKYRVLVYHSTDSGSAPFGYDTINGTNYTYVNDALVEGTTAWGNAGAQDSANAIAEGGNVLVTEALSGSTLTVVGHRAGGDSSARGCIAAIQIIEVKADVGENDLEIPVSSDTQYTVEETKELSGTVYLTGLGTLTLAGENKISAATIEISEGVTLVVDADRLDATTFTGAGTVVYDGSQPDTTKGFDNSAWTGTVWVKNVGDTTKGEATDAKVTTLLGSNTTDASSNDLNKWGNANSFVKFTNVRGYMAKTSVAWTLILEDDSSNYAWYNNEGWSDYSITIAALKGDGTFWDINDAGCRPFLNFGDASQFSGNIKALGKQVFLGDASNTGSGKSTNGGRIVVAASQTLTVASGKTWHTRNGLVVNGTLNVNGTLASDSTTAAVSGSGTVVFTGRAPTPTGDTWWKNSNWTGTTAIRNYSDWANIDLSVYGNSSSAVRFSNVSGWFKSGSATYDTTLELDDTDGLAFTHNDGYNNNVVTIKALKGSGTYYGNQRNSSDPHVTVVFKDASEFRGSVKLNTRRVVFADSATSNDYVAGNIYIAEGAQVTVQNTAEAAWWAVGGIQVDGELRANSLDRFGGGTSITTSDNGVFTLTSTGNGAENETDTNYARIKGTGSLKYEGTGWRALTTNNLSTAVTLVNEQSGDILLSRALTYTVGSLSGSKNFQGNYGSGNRYLNVIQSKDTEWSGKVVDDGYSRFAGLKLDASSTGTLTLSGTASQNVALDVNGGAVNLTGTWKGATTVAGTFGGTGTLTGDLTFSEGATFKAFAADDEDGLVVSGTVGYPAEGKVTVDVGAIEPESDVALIKAADLNRDKFALADGTPEGYSLDVVEGVLTLKVPVTEVTITVPAIANATVTVSVGGETIGTEAGTYKVAPDAVVTATYAAAEGYEISGQTVYTINVANSETTFDPAGTTEVKQYVARVRNYGTNKNEDFTSLNAAIAVADGTTYANFITLLADITDAVTIDKPIYLSGQGKTISAAVTISSGGNLSLMGPTLTGKLTIGANGAFAQVGTGSVLPEVETQDGASIALSTLSADTVALTVTKLTVNGTLTLSSTAQGTERGTPYKAFSYVTDNATFGEGAEIVGGGVYSASTEVEGDKTVVSMTITAVAKIGDEYYDDLDEAVADAIANDTVVELLIQPEAAVTLDVGQTLKVKAYSYTLDVNLASGLTNPPYSISSALDIDTTITTYTVNAAFAKIGNTTYPTLAAAIDAATSGATVTLLADVTLDSTLTLPAGKTLTMDLGGFTIYSGNDSSKRIVVNGTVTMTNGVVDGQTTVYDPNNGTAMIRVNGSLTLGANLTIRNTINAVAAFGTGSLTVNGATINALGFAISTNGIATGDNASNGTVLAINSGTITSTDVAVYLPSGTMTINGGAITGSTGVYAKGGSLSVPSTSTAVITGNGANAGWSYNGNGANSTGDALVIDNSDYPYGPATAMIAGGTYESTNGDAIGNYTKDAETLPTATGFVTGGTFSSDVSAFCADGYAATESDGVWTVAEVQEVPVEPGKSTEPVDTKADAEAAAAKVVPSVPAAVAAKLTDEQETAYKELFEAKVVTVTDGETTKYAVKVELKENVKTALQADVDAEAEDLAKAAVAAAADATNGGTAKVTTKPGLYYVVEAGSELNGIAPASCTLATSAETTLPVPNMGTSGFYKISVSVTEVSVTTTVEP